MTLEDVKRSSRFLRGTLAEELADPSDAFSGDNTALLKFHGIYQQDDRDQRRALTQKRQPLAYSCMVRTSLPGGVLTAEQYLAMDALTDKVSDGTLRVTTRQDIQFHFVGKGDLHSLVALAEAGHGVAVVPSTLEVAARRLEALPILVNRQSLGIWCGVAWDPRRALPVYAKGFMEALARHVRRGYPGSRFDRTAPPVQRGGARLRPGTAPVC